MTQQRMNYKGYVVLTGDGHPCGRCGTAVPSQLMCADCKGQFCLVACIPSREWGGERIQCPNCGADGISDDRARQIMQAGPDRDEACADTEGGGYRIRYGGGWLEGLRADRVVSVLIPNVTVEHRDRLIALYREQHGDEWLQRLQDDRERVEYGRVEPVVESQSVPVWQWERRNGTAVAVITVSPEQARTMAPKPGDVITVVGRDGQSSRQVVLRGWPEPRGERFALVVEVEKYQPHGRRRSRARARLRSDRGLAGVR